MAIRSANFLDAHKRHWEDAELLRKELRWANADHLYGVAAECGLKFLIQVIAPRAWQNDEPIQKDKAHVMEQKKQNIWDRYQTYLEGSQGARYTLPQDNPFLDWDISDRYAERAHFSEASVAPHRHGAEAVRQLVERAKKGNESA
ncbi:MAG: hypothetical protein RLZZ298_1551 [Pseudomonadota bacterium]|jgi:hypothetical protein